MSSISGQVATCWHVSSRFLVLSAWSCRILACKSANADAVATFLLSSALDAVWQFCRCVNVGRGRCTNVDHSPFEEQIHQITRKVQFTTTEIIFLSWWDTHTPSTGKVEKGTDKDNKTYAHKWADSDPRLQEPRSPCKDVGWEESRPTVGGEPHGTECSNVSQTTMA